MVKDHIQKALSDVLVDLGISSPVNLDVSRDLQHGDFVTNVAFTASKVTKQNPVALAETIKEKLGAIEGVEKVEVVAPGFINFYLTSQYIVSVVEEFSKQKERRGAKTGKKVMVEFTDPNPFKELHIGHLYSNVVGESLCRLLESQGADVWRVTYQGDVGLHVAKSIWGMQEKMRDEGVTIEVMDQWSLKEKVKFLGQAYALGAKMYDDPSIKETINALNKMIYASTGSAQADKDSSISDLYEKGREWSLAYFDEIYARLGSKFVKNYFESVAGPIGLQLVKAHVKDGIFTESDGAIVFEGEKYGLHTRVFVNSLGLPTYEAKDMGLPPTKYKDFPYDESIIITANEQSAYFQVVLKALSLINPDLAAKTKHIGHGMIRLPEGKMSSRTGNILTGEWLLDEAAKRIQEAYPDMDHETAEMVSISAVKYALLRGGIGRDTAFSFEESISLEGNSGPYLQYTYVRTQSILRRGKGEAGSGKFLPFTLYPSPSLNPEEALLLRTLVQFEEVVQKAADELAPHILCTYLFETAKLFNLFYQKHSVLQGDNKEFRLFLTSVTGEALKRGLDLLGIKVPQKM